MSSNLYIDIHVLQTVPPSCVNRDDTGSPKTAVYGGVTRARVSSQAWKRAIRMEFGDEVGIRTKKIVDLVARKIADQSPEQGAQKAQKLAIEALKKAGLNVKEKNPEKGTDALFFMNDDQAAALAKLICAGEKSENAYKNALIESPSVDMVLFGRMAASDASLNYDAAAQVAHSISTHEVRNEFDFFTAVDDLDKMGAAYLDTAEFNSSTLYRYATVNVRKAAEWLKDDTPHAIRSFVNAFLCSMPTGKQNSFANRTAPDCVYVTVRKDQPVNLVGAFEKPIRSREGYVAASEARLAEYAKETYDRFVDKPALALCVSRHADNWVNAENLGREQLLERVEQVVREACESGEVD